MSSAAGLQLQCSCAGSAGKGTLWVRADTDGDGGPLTLEMLLLKVGEDYVEVDLD